MLSYQHAYHAGNMADVHKHTLLAWMLDYLTRKDKPLSYIETHAGRGLYDLSGAEAVKTGEAASGIALADRWFAQDHPYARALKKVRATHGDTAYPGSPLIAQSLLRPTDSIRLADLHPQEYDALRRVARSQNTQVFRQDGFELAHSICPPTPRRGLLLIDPSYEIRDDYDRLPKILGTLHQKWNVGVLALWYPILTSAEHLPMVAALKAGFDTALCSEVRFPPARKGHRMVGSGMFIINPPYGLEDQVAWLNKKFATLR